MNHTAKAAEVRQTVQRLIESGSAYDVAALDRIYHKQLKIIKIDERDDVTVINREENMAFFRSKLKSGAEPLSREAEFLHVEADERSGHVVVVRRMKLTDRFEKSVFSIRLVWEEGRRQVIDETAFVRPAE
ncbi:MAG: hypothetical protein M3371_07275 [Acidobacteriota bacterium]|nr:hypothetical protein [Acidobacteriota bacterium]